MRTLSHLELDQRRQLWILVLHNLSRNLIWKLNFNITNHCGDNTKIKKKTNLAASSSFEAIPFLLQDDDTHSLLMPSWAGWGDVLWQVKPLTSMFAATRTCYITSWASQVSFMQIMEVKHQLHCIFITPYATMHKLLTYLHSQLPLSFSLFSSPKTW